MEFGQWVRAMRNDREMDMRILALESGVDSSTISRIERKETEATLLTAIRLCRAFEVTPEQMARSLKTDELPRPDQGDAAADEDTDTPSPESWPFPDEIAEGPTRDDVMLLLRLFQQQATAGISVVAGLVREVANYCVPDLTSWLEPQPGGLVPLVVSLLTDWPFLEATIPYPRQVDATMIRQIYLAGGFLILPDVGVYVKEQRRTHPEQLRKMEEQGILSPHVLRRLENGAVEQIKLQDLLNLDSGLSRVGDVLGMYAEVAAGQHDVLARIGPRLKIALPVDPSGKPGDAATPTRAEIDVNRLILVFVTLSRWALLAQQRKPGWVAHLRTWMQKNLEIESGPR